MDKVIIDSPVCYIKKDLILCQQLAIVLLT